MAGRTGLNQPNGPCWMIVGGNGAGAGAGGGAGAPGAGTPAGAAPGTPTGSTSAGGWGSDNETNPGGSGGPPTRGVPCNDGVDDDGSVSDV